MSEKQLEEGWYMKKQSYPTQIAVNKNPIMGKFDLAVMVGGFETEAEAKAFADQIAEVLVGAGMKLDLVQ